VPDVMAVVIARLAVFEQLDKQGFGTRGQPLMAAPAKNYCYRQSVRDGFQNLTIN
jgi:hypothetical protein